MCHSLIGNSRHKKPNLQNCQNDVETANAFSSFFIEKVRKIHGELDDQAKQMTSNSLVSIANPESRASKTQQILTHFRKTDTEEIEEIIGKSNSKTCDLDPLPTVIFKMFVKQLSVPLTLIINKSLSCGEVPTSFKTAIVTPVLKKSHLDPNEVSNYRPISNLQFTSKVLEKVVFKRLDEHFEKNHLMSDNQSAYRRNHSTETLLIKISNDILTALNHGKSTLLVTLDISAAFDTVNRQMLLQRYESDFGISDGALDWVASYLTDRQQKVRVGSAYSSLSYVDSGFPQGSVLGGFKYNAFTSPLDALIRQHNVEDQCYADDSNLYVSFAVKDEGETQASLSNLTDCLDHVKKWMIDNRLLLNSTKTEAILFQSPLRVRQAGPHNVSLDFDGHSLSFSSHIESLGVILDDKMKMERQVNATTKIAYFYLHKKES